MKCWTNLYEDCACLCSFFLSCVAKAIQIVETMFSGEESNVLDKEIP